MELLGMRMNLVEDKATVDTQHVISPRPKTTCPATKCSAPVPERTKIKPPMMPMAAATYPIRGRATLKAAL